MPRSIKPSEEHQRVPQEAVVRRNTSIRRIVNGSVDCRGADPTESAAALVADAGERSGLSGDDAIALAVEETRAERWR